MAKAGNSKWVPRSRDYTFEKTQWCTQPTPTKYHPLLSTEILKKVDEKQEVKASNEKQEAKPAVVAEKPKPKRDFVDPLSMFGGGGGEEDDPLSSRSGNNSNNNSSNSGNNTNNSSSAAPVVVHIPIGEVQSTGQKQSKVRPEFEPWSDKMPRILQKYTTNKRIAVTANFLEEEEKEGNASAKPVDQAKARLEQLEIDEHSDEAKSMMTQTEYIAHMEDQHLKLKQAWDSGERVVALKISIQCAKLLGDTTVPAFYPSMYVLLTTVLDTFGDLVFQRIKSRGIDLVGQAPRALPNNFKSSDVSNSAKETCRNWFFKTACIRELMPRLYIDMALIKSYRFLDEHEYVHIFARLSHAIRGIGDPLAATYARAFLTTKLNDVSQSFQPDPSLYYPPAENLKKSILEAFDDFMFTFKSIKHDDFKGINHVIQQKVTADEYVDLYSPALEWILQNIGFNSPEDLFFGILKEAQESCKNSAVLIHILSSFRATYVSNNALEMCKYIREAAENSFVKKSKLYLTLGHALLKAPPPQKQRLPILSEVWKVVAKIEDPTEYMDIAVVFIQYILVNASEREVNIFLKDVIKHVKQDQAHIKLQDQLQSIVLKVMEHNQDLERTLSMDNFLPVIDLLERGTKVPAGKMILQAFSRSKMISTSDPVIVHTLFDVARSLHDSIDSMTFEDERRQIGDLIVSFVRKIDFGRDLEKQLNIYVDCRQAFTNLDKVTAELVLRVVKLANRANAFMKGKHTRKTAAFVKACLAYCHITIPSLEDFFTRLHLFLQCGETAYVSQMSVQGEAFLKAAISLIPEIPSKQENPITKKVSSTEPELVGFIRNFSSFLLYCPGHPTSGPFYLVKGLLNAINTYEPWKAAGSVGKTKVYLGLLSLFATYHQTKFPSHIERVESNDSLYACDEAYKTQLYELLTGIIEAIMTQLAEIGNKGDLIAKKDQGTLALEFVNILVVAMEMNPTSATMVVRLVQLAQNTKAVDAKYLAATLAHIRSQKGSWYEDISNKISALQEGS